MGYSAKSNKDGITDIKVVKGDTFIHQVNVYAESKLRYVPCASDDIYFEVYKSFANAEPLLKMKIPYNTMTLMLSSNKTASFRVGNYVYCIRIEFQNGFVDTVLSGNFEVVYPGGER